MNWMQRRRAAMMGAKKLPITNPELIYTPNMYLDSKNSPATCEGGGYTDYYPCQAGDTITYYNPPANLPHMSNGNLGKITVYNGRKNQVDSWNCRMGTTWSFRCERFSGSGYFRLNICMANIAGSYAYNQTTGQIYYAGINTSYYGKTNIND